MLVVEPGARQQFAQLQIAGAVLDQQQQARRLVALVVVADPDIAADDRLDALATGGLVKLDHAEQIGQVADAKRRLAVFKGGFDHVVEAHQAIDDRIFGMQAEVGKLRRAHRAILPVHPVALDHRKPAADKFIMRTAVRSVPSY